MLRTCVLTVCTDKDSFLTAAYGAAGWADRLVAFQDIPAAAASIGQVHRGQWRTGGGQVVEVAVKVQYPGVGQALRSDLRQARLLARVTARLTRLNVSGHRGKLSVPGGASPGREAL